MASKVEKVAVFRYAGQNYENYLDVLNALRRDIIAQNIDYWDSLVAKEYFDATGKIKPSLAQVLADRWDTIDREVSTSIAGTGIN